MEKKELDKKLAGDSFKEYLEACNNLKKYVMSGGKLDQGIIERALFVNLIQLWAQHKDLDEKFEEITNELPKHSELLENFDTKSDLTGISMFVNGLLNGNLDISGFLWCNSSGYVCSSTSCENIAEYYEKEGKEKEASYFLALSDWFLEIYSATTAVFGAIMEIKNWNEEMIQGLTNFLTKSLSYGKFEWILGGLYSVVDEPLIQEKVFNYYLNMLKKARDKFKKEDNKSAVEELNSKIKGLKKLAKGESI